MDNEMTCPHCASVNVYHDGNLWVCPDCAHEWNPATDGGTAGDEGEGTGAVRGANGNLLNVGESVSLIKDLKVKGASLVLKNGTKVKNIRLVDGPDGHNIACKIDGIGAMNLKSEFVKKA